MNIYIKHVTVYDIGLRYLNHARGERMKLGLLDKIIKQEDIDSGIHSGESYIIWTQIVARYDTLELVDVILNFSNDLDFKLLVKRGIDKVIKPQLNQLIEKAKYYRLPLPPRPPESQNLSSNMETFRDEFLYKLLMDGSQTGLDVHLKAIKICINDALRDMFMEFILQEMKLYDELIKYGKVKGWLENAPIYKNN
jgi:hypothetical protein